MDILTRDVSFELDEVRSAADGDGLTLAGYAAVFNQPTRIRGEGPDYDEMIARGAFAKTLKERTPVLMFEHGLHPLIGKLPIGNITTLREDARGLYVEARLHDNWLVQPVRDALASKAIKGMSFRFSVPKDKSTVDRSGEFPLVTRHEVKCPELGPVVFPAYEGAVVGVRAMFESLDDATRSEIVEAFKDLASDDLDRDAADTAEDTAAMAIINQIKPLVGQLVALEGESLQAGDDVTGELSVLVSMLSSLCCYEDMNDPTEDVPMDGMNSADPDTQLEAAADHGTSDDESSRSDAEPLPDGTPQPMPIEAARFALLRLKRTA